MPRKPSDSHIDSPAEVGRRLREARLRAGLSQRELAFDGCTAAYISRIEAGARVPSLQLLIVLGERLGVSADVLARGRESSSFDDPLREAEFMLRLGDAQEAEARFRELLDDGLEGRARARALGGLAQARFEAGEHEAAIELFEEAGESWRNLPDEDPAVAENLGRSYAMTSQYDLALAVFERALAHARERDDPIGVTRFSVLIANTLVDRGSFGRAEELLAGVLANTAEGADPVTQARLWWTRSRLYALQEEHALAERYAQLALDTLVLTDHVRYAALAHQVLAHVLLDQGKAAEALELLERGEPFVERGGNLYEAALFRIERARALAKLDRGEEALPLVLESADRLVGASPIDAGRAYAILAEVQESLGDADAAAAAYRHALELLPVSDRYKRLSYTRLADLLRREGRSDEALDVLTEALEGQQADAADLV